MRYGFIKESCQFHNQFFLLNQPAEIIGLYISPNQYPQYLIKKQKNIRNTQWGANIKAKLEPPDRFESYTDKELKDYVDNHLDYLWIIEREVEFLKENKDMKKSLIKWEE